MTKTTISENIILTSHSLLTQFYSRVDFSIQVN